MMTDTKDVTSEYKHIAIIRLSALGDIVHTIPAFNTLRIAFPNAKIHWFAEPTGAKLLENVSGIDQIITTRLKTRGLKNKFKELKLILSNYKNHFDLVLDFQGLIKSASLARLLKSHVVGFDTENLKESQARFFYSQQAERFDETQHVIYKNLHLVEHVLPTNHKPKNCNSRKISYPLNPISTSHHLSSFLRDNDLEEKNFIIMNVGGGWETKILAMDQYIDIIGKIKDKYQIVILWGNETEKKRASHISTKTNTIICPFLDFKELIQFIRKARLVVTSDTLALHLADMVQTPSVGIFGPTSPARNGSLLTQSTAVFENTNCNFCYKKKCGTIECIKNLNISKIVESIELTYEKHC